MRDYGKVHTVFWTSSDIRAMSEAGRVLAIYLLTCPHGTIAGVFRLPDGYACDDLQWDSERVREGFVELIRSGFANRCETTKWVWIMKHFEWNPLENPNQKKAAAKVASQVPDECDWKQQFIQSCGHFFDIAIVSQTNGTKTLSKRFSNQEQKQKQEQEQEQEITNPGGLAATADNSDMPAIINKSAKPDCPHQKIIALYHEVLPQCPQVRDWTPARATQLRTRWNEDEKRQNLVYWRNLFEYVKECDFLVGKSGKTPFFADLEWITKAGNFTKIREGKYENREAA